MGFEITEVRGTPISTRLKQFVCDTVADVANLPTNTKKGTSSEGQKFEEETVDIGSTCLVLEDSSVWMLSPNGTWVEL